MLIDGDGSFNMTSNDLGTVKEHNLPIKMVRCGMLKRRQRSLHVPQPFNLPSKLCINGARTLPV